MDYTANPITAVLHGAFKCRVEPNILAACALLLLPTPCFSKIWLVGPEYSHKLPSQVAQIAKDDDVVLIQAGSYSGDVASWRQNHLTLRGIGDGRAHLDAQGRSADDKALWVIKGNDVIVENIEFSGSQVPDLNGAGIRFEGSNLILRNCHFHHNQMGILTGTSPRSDILIEGSEFNDNTVDYSRYHALGHNIYIGKVRRFTLRNSYVHDAQTGHNVKSRAGENYLLYNRIDDEHNASSYLVDFPDGGHAYVIGNLFRQSPNSDNSIMLSFAAEHNRNAADQALYLANNTFVNSRSSGIFINNHSPVPSVLINNLLIGQSSRMQGQTEEKNNLAASTFSFAGTSEYDYHLPADSPAVDQGIMPGFANNGFDLRPRYQYVHPLNIENRPEHGALDIGAYEY